MSRILVINPGSSTLKYAWFEDTSVVETQTLQVSKDGLHDAIQTIVKQQEGSSVDAIGYRIVHGGVQLTKPTRLDSQVMAQLRSTVHLAPLHQTPAISTMDAAMEVFPDALHVGCFDTAFHATLPMTEQLLPLPRTHYESGIRRYGFHGLSYESIASQLPEISPRAAQGRTVVCHLGSGASLCGFVECVSRYTTMGFTPQDGLIMSTRAGRIDSGVILHLLRNHHSVLDVETILTQRSGLLGLSGLSGDMRELTRLSATQSIAKQSIEIFCRCVAKEISAAATAIGGLDAIVMTAGIGEHCPGVRTQIIDQLSWIGAEMDEPQNQLSACRIHSTNSKVEILCIPTNEQLVIARHALHMLETGRSVPT
jgi:acetate kinase